jgi:DNA polymerase I
MKDIYLIDASGWIYRSYFAIKNMTNSKGESTNALFGFIRSVMKLIKDFNPQYLASVFDGPRNGIKREAIYPQYKAHRKEMPQDLRYQIEWAHKFCDLMGIPQLNIPEVEADDVMGSVAKFASNQEANTYLCTSDKDFCQLVDDKIFILNTHKENLIINAHEVEKIYGVLPRQMIDYLAIIGDASDNIPGLPGLGPKTAAELLKNFGSLDYLLEHPKEVPGAKKQEVLTKEKDLALLSKKLVTIDLHVDIPKEVQFYQLRTPDKLQLKEFYKQMNFNSLFKELESLEVPGAAPADIVEDYHLVDDETSFQSLLGHLSKQQEICFDTKTTDPHPLKAKLTGIGFATEPTKAWYVPVNGNLGTQRVLEGLRPLFEHSNIGFYGHNLKYNYHVLANHGIKIQKLSFDTILASYILNSHQRQHSLDSLLLESFGKIKRISLSDLLGKGQKQICISEAPIEKVCAYCCEDVDFTLRLKQLLEKQLKERKLDKLLYQLELPLLPVLAKMERQGIYVDLPFLKNMSEQISHEIRALENEIHSMAGTEFNLNSPLQLKKILFEKLAIPFPKRSKETSTGEEILDLLKETYPITGKILEYRKLEKLRSTYVDSLPLEVEATTHRIHCTFNQSVAATGRLSCQNPNLQNIPIRTEIGSKIREAFRPEKKGWSYLAADYSQIELRLLAHMSEDPDMMQAFQNNEDIHAHTAAAIYNIPLNEVSKTQRYSAKAVNFGIVYGQQAFGLSQALNISTAEASHFIETYFRRFSKVKDFIENSKEQARKSGRSVTMTGRERLIPEINSKNGMIRSQAERLAINTPLQGTAADLIKKAMIEIDIILKKHQTLGYMILQIHDELIFELPDFEIISLQPLIKNAMEQVFKLKVPLIVDIAVGKNWKEC